ncbi:hypothetical protein [Amycolatopsis sp. 195334CR]|uniref:hypothetical protein n=1 Tax=Amycolatopsis sp. 195334CR TaxID=2814588 RepID=UPI001A8DEBA9|nr:hypothetical protein [Amycolatopsis sp. 195334CR]MBN6036298.1 hypothetical protein [Amycolatopsis sp. 195334CR]
MKKSLARGVAAAVLYGIALVGVAAPALADPVIVDEPDTSELNNIWTFAPLGVPVLGLVQSVVKAPNNLIPN